MRVLKVPYDSGHRCERMARGPGYLLSHGLFTGAAVEAIESACLPEVQCAFDLARQLAVRVSAIRETGEPVFVLSGNCANAIGTVAGLGCARTGVLWFDAHGEFHTPETTMSGFFDGMPLAVLTGRCWRVMADTIPGFTPVPENRIVLAGARDIDPAERTALEASKIAVVRERAALEAALDRIAADIDQWYIHLDLDVLDPAVATANAWTPPDGLQPEDLASAIRHAASRKPIGGVGIASFDPACDADGRALAVARGLIDVTLDVTQNNV